MLKMGWTGNSKRRAGESVDALRGFGISLKKCYDRREDKDDTGLIGRLEHCV
jgi:hypothetical protein